MSVSIWRYEHAITAHDGALASFGEELRAQRAVTDFWHEREAMNEYLVSPNAEVLAEIGDQGTAFDRGFTADSAKERALIGASKTGNHAFVAEFRRVQTVARTTSPREAGDRAG